MHERQALSILMTSDYTAAQRPGGHPIPIVSALREVAGEGPSVRLDYQGKVVVIWGQQGSSDEPQPLWYVTKATSRRLAR